MTIDKNKKMNKGEVTHIEHVANEMFLIKIKAAKDFSSKAGQFISILCGNHTMRRPFSIMDFEDGVISVLFKRKGDGTAFISALKVGDTVDFIGPMGNGFNCVSRCSAGVGLQEQDEQGAEHYVSDVSNSAIVDNNCSEFVRSGNLADKTLCVGAGVGVAPVYYLKKVLGDKAKLIAGFQNENEIPACLKSEIDFIATDDGTGDGVSKGSIIDYLDVQIKEFKPERIAVCGPHIVLKLVAQKAKEYGIPSEVAMEKTMACSIGVCRGCVITLNRNGEIGNASVCKDGPVFLGEEVVW